MTKYDLQALATQINLLAEVYEKKPVSPKALEVWFDTLKDFPAERVLSLLISWPKTHLKFPVPSEVWKACNERALGEREAKAEAERAENLRQPFIRSERGAEFLARMRTTLARPKRSAREHWRHVLATAPSGSIGHRYASEILARLEQRQGNVPIAREPGQDDEERAA